MGMFWCAGGRFVRMAHGSAARWLPLVLLALFAAADFVAQYLFIATSFSEALHIPDAVLHFIEARPILAPHAHGQPYECLLDRATRTL